MADEGKQSPPQPSAPKPAAEETEERRYSVDELRENARSLVGASPHAVVGALAAERKKTFTADEAKKAIAAFLKRPDSTIPKPEDDA